MERFAIKIDNALKLNLYKLCRLCGIDHPDKRPIISSLSLMGLNDDDEPDLSKKILDCVGIQVKKNDHMPQNICSLCSDKICDFYEYREMCAATNVQTRKLLGLPEIVPNTGRKRKGKDKIKAEESILGIDGADEEDDKKNIIPHIPTTAAGVKGGGGGGKAGRKKNIGPMSATAAGTSKSSIKGIKRTYENMDSMINDDADDDDVDIKIENDYSGIKSSYSASAIAKRSNLRNSSSFSNLLEPMVVITPLSELLMPKTESMGGTVLAKPKKSVKFKSDVTVATTPLLTTKALNKRERKREIEMEKLEKKKKRKNGPVDITGDQPQPKVLKTEPISELCPICCQVLEIQLNDHLIMEHCPRIQKFGCSSCGESFKTNDEQKDHHLWHSLSQTLYKCNVCALSFDKLQTFIRHVNLCIPLDVSKYLVDDIICDICKKIFPTRNSHDCHKCYLKTNGLCLRCNRRFVKKATLKRHISECTGDYSLFDAAAQAKLLSEQLAAVAAANILALATVGAAGSGGIKSEPEAILDSDVTMPNLKIIEANSVPSMTTTTTTTTTENTNNDGNFGGDGGADDDYDDGGGDMGGNGDDHHFGGESSDDNDDKNTESHSTTQNTTLANKPSEISGELMNIKSEPSDLGNYGGDDGNDTDGSDVIIVENDTTPVVIADDFTSPQKKRDKKLKKHKKDKQRSNDEDDGGNETDLSTLLLLGTSVKQEPTDNYFADNENQINNTADDNGADANADGDDDADGDNDEAENSLMNALNPEIRIKTEPIENDVNNSAMTTIPPTTTTTTAPQKKKEKRHKQSKEKRTPHIDGVRIKQEPRDDTETAISSSSSSSHTTSNTVLNPCSHPVVSFPCGNQSSTPTAAATAASLATSSSSTSSQLPFSINIKKEPITSGYIEPHMIKKEPIDRPANKQPSLRLKITKQHGTLNAKIIPNKSKASEGGAPAASATTSITNENDSNAEVPLPSQSIPPPSPSIDEENEATLPMSHHTPSTSSETPTTPTSTSTPVPAPATQPAQKSSKKPKNIYKMPALLALKIKQEKMARLAKEKEALENQQKIPLIAHVTSGQLPPIQIKMEKLSPTHEPDYGKHPDDEDDENNESKQSSISQPEQEQQNNDNVESGKQQESHEIDREEIPLQETNQIIELENKCEHLENNESKTTEQPETMNTLTSPTLETPTVDIINHTQLNNVDQLENGTDLIVTIDEKETAAIDNSVVDNDSEQLSNECEANNMPLPEIPLLNHEESSSVTLSNDTTVAQFPQHSTSPPAPPTSTSTSSPPPPTSSSPQAFTPAEIVASSENIESASSSPPTPPPFTLPETVPSSENIESEPLISSAPTVLPEIPAINETVTDDDKMDTTDVIQRENEATLSRLVEIGSGAKKLLSDDDELNQINDLVESNSQQNVNFDQPSLQDNHYLPPPEDQQQLPSPSPSPKPILEQLPSTLTKDPEQILQQQQPNNLPTNNSSFTDQYYDDQLDDLSDDSLTDVLGPATDGGIDNSNTAIDWELEQKLLDETPQQSSSSTTNHNNQIH